MMSASDRTDRRRIAVGEIDAAVRQANIVDDAVHFRGRNLLPDRILDQIAQERRVLNAHTGWRAQVQFEAARIHGRKEILTEPGNEHSETTETSRKERSRKARR